MNVPRPRSGWMALMDWVLAIATLLAMLGWLAVGTIGVAWYYMDSGQWIVPVSMSYEKTPDGKWRGTSVRKTPRGGVTAKRTTHLSAPGRPDCHADITDYVQEVKAHQSADGPNPADTIYFDAPPSLWACLNASRPVTANYSWRVLLWGVVPMPEVTLSVILE